MPGVNSEEQMQKLCVIRFPLSLSISTIKLAQTPLLAFSVDLVGWTVVACEFLHSTRIQTMQIIDGQAARSAATAHLRRTGNRIGYVLLPAVDFRAGAHFARPAKRKYPMVSR